MSLSIKRDVNEEQKKLMIHFFFRRHQQNRNLQINKS